MTDKAIKYLSDVQNSISLIDSFLVGIDNFGNYQSDPKTQSAVERQLVGFRNRIIHSYDNIDISIVWAIIKNHLPTLKEEVNEILKQKC